MSEWKETEIGLIPKDWEVAELGKIADVTKLAGFEFTEYIEYIEGGEIIALRALNVRNGELDLNDVKTISKNASDSLVRSKLYKNDILFTYVGANIGQFALVDADDKYHLAPNICRIRVSNEFYTYFLFSYFRTETFKKIVNKYVVGSSQPTLPMKNIRQITVPYPSKAEQKQIADILSCLDNKIDNLRRQNETLETIAQTLFKHWFIDFEFPNDDGKPYKSSGGAMVASELGDIPEGWRVGTLGDVITQANTGADAIQKAPIVDEDTGIKCLRIGDITNNKQFEEWGYCKVTEKHFLQYQLKKGDILITRTSALGLNILILKDLNAVFNNGLIKIRIKNNINTFFVYCFMQSKRYKDYIARITYETTTRPNMQINYLLDFPLLFVNKDLEDNFSLFVSKILLKQHKNNEQIQTLTKTRDTLLPKLMSGQIRIKEVESLIEKVK